MSNIESAEQATQFLDRAQEFLDSHRDNEAYQLLEAVEQSNLLPSEHRARLYWLLGESCYMGQSYDAAYQYYEQAAAAGDSTIAERARARIAEFQRSDAASETAYGEGGVNTADELTQVVTAAEEALQRNDVNTAYDLFSRAYQYPGAIDNMALMARVAVGLGKTLFQQQQYDQAREYLVYVGQLVSSGEAADEARRVLEQLDQLQRATAGVGDGVQAGEVRDTMEAGLAAYQRGDYQTAAQMFEQVFEAQVVDGTMRVAAAHNAGASHRGLGNYDVAVQWYEEAVRLGSSDSQRQIDRIRAGDAAMEQIGEDILTNY